MWLQATLPALSVDEAISCWWKSEQISCLLLHSLNYSRASAAAYKIEEASVLLGIRKSDRPQKVRSEFLWGFFVLGSIRGFEMTTLFPREESIHASPGRRLRLCACEEGRIPAPGSGCEGRHGRGASSPSAFSSNTTALFHARPLTLCKTASEPLSEIASLSDLHPPTV